MRPIHDVDVLLLLATTQASKRRPAELVEILVAADLLQSAIAFEAKVIDAFYRLSTQGLLCEVDGGYTLTPEAQKIMAGMSKKRDLDQRIFSIKEGLASYVAKGEHAPVRPTADQLRVAILAKRTATAGATRSLLVPKPKPVEGNQKGPGFRHRKPLPARRRKP